VKNKSKDLRLIFTAATTSSHQLLGRVDDPP